MNTLKGVKIWMPKGATLTARPGLERTLELQGVGKLADMRIVEEGKAFEMTFEATTGAGEFLADCLRSGKAQLVLTSAAGLVAGQKARLRLVVGWIDGEAHSEWLYKYELVSQLGGFA